MQSEATFQTDSPIVIRHNAAQSRYEAYNEAGHPLGHLDYVDIGSAALLTHTEIDPAYGGQGYGSELVRGALEALRTEGKLIVPECVFVAGFLQKYPEYLQLVHPNQRGQLGMEEHERR